MAELKFTYVNNNEESGSLGKLIYEFSYEGKKGNMEIDLYNPFGVTREVRVLMQMFVTIFYTIGLSKELAPKYCLVQRSMYEGVPWIIRGDDADKYFREILLTEWIKEEVALMYRNDVNFVAAIESCRNTSEIFKVFKGEAMILLRVVFEYLLCIILVTLILSYTSSVL